MTAVVEHRYRPRGACRKLFAARDDEVLLSGPAGTGKSRGCLEKLHLMALLNERMRGLILRKTLVSLGSTALVTWREHVVPEALEHGVCWYHGGSQEEPPGYRYQNGSFIAIGGLDKPTKIMSSEYDVAYVQEAIELVPDDWEAVTTRLRNGRMSFQQLIADTNPSTPTHWLKQRCDAGKTRMLDSRHEDNPTLYGEDGELTERGAAYMTKLDRLTGPRYYRLRKGLWVAAEGIIYEGWDPVIHLVDLVDLPGIEFDESGQPRVPGDWPRFWTVDFGYTNPFVLQCWARDPDGRLVLYREIYHTRRLVRDHAFRIMEFVTRPDPDYRSDRHLAHEGRLWTEPQPERIICDHDAEGRAQLERELGMSTEPAHKAVTEGIQATDQRLRTEDDGRPRLFIVRDCRVERDPELVDAELPTCTAEEIPGYVWLPPAANRRAKEEPLKQDDHGCDAMRYMVADQDLGDRPGMRWLTL